MISKQAENQRESLYELTKEERRLILAYRKGNAEKSVNLLKDQGLLPASFPTRPDKR